MPLKEGRFKNVSEVVRAGLRLLEQEESKHQALRAALIEGKESGTVENYDRDAHLKSIQEKYHNKNGNPQKQPTDKFWSAVKPIRQSVTIEELIKEQNYTPITAEEFYKEVAELNIEEPLDELLAMLTP